MLAPRRVLLAQPVYISTTGTLNAFPVLAHHRLHRQLWLLPPFPALHQAP
jgi:hypothetical protein